MTHASLKSCLAASIAAFIQKRQLSGSDYRSQAQLLGYFDRFLVEQRLRQPRLTRLICERYEELLGRLAPRGRENRFCVVRQFAQYLATRDPQSYVPDALPSLPHRATFLPHIFAPEQVGAILEAASQLPPPESLRPYTYRTLFGLLYSTGIRVGEAFALNIEHFFADERRLYVAEGKFRKSRWLVLSVSAAQAVQRYLDRRMRRSPNAPDSPLLINERSGRLCHPTVHSTYRQLLQQCGIKTDKGPGPRLHDLRHTFAVHRLLAWYRAGTDVNARLPALATYMGHVDIASTHIYLQPTTELLGEVNRRFHNHYLKHLTSKGISQ